MTSISRSHSNRQSEPVLSWIFHRDARAITCQVDVHSSRSYDVCVVPHWDVASSVVEHCAAPTVALLRHAEIARRLQESGWVLADRVPNGRTAVAA